jgi:hypothetical protein
MWFEYGKLISGNILWFNLMISNKFDIIMFIGRREFEHLWFPDVLLIDEIF